MSEPGALSTFVVSLERSAARRAHMRTQLDRLGIRFEWVAAVDGRSVATPAPPELTPGEWGCLLSHRLALSRAVGAGTDWALVLEDDCALAGDTPGLLQQRSRFPADAGLVLLGHHSARRGAAAGAHVCFRGIRLAGSRKLARVAEFAMGAYAYLIRREAARKLLDYGEPPRMPADWLTGYAPRAGIGLYAISPPCVAPDPVLDRESTIREPDAVVGVPVAEPRSLDWRAAGGAAWLILRKLGMRPYAYARRAP